MGCLWKVAQDGPQQNSFAQELIDSVLDYLNTKWKNAE